MARRRVPERPAPAAPVSSKRRWWLIAFGLAAVLAFAIATLPASVLARQLPRLDLSAAALSGSVWTGHAQALSWRSAPLGDLSWSISPLSLLRGGVAGDLELVRADGRVRSGFSASLGGALRLEGVTADLPVEALATLTPVYEETCTHGPEGVLWLHTSLDIGVHTTYPGGAAPRELTRYNPRMADWYGRARFSFEASKRMTRGESGPDPDARSRFDPGASPPGSRPRPGER